MPYKVEANHLRLLATLPASRLVILADRHRERSAQELTEQTDWRNIFVPAGLRLTLDLTEWLKRLSDKGWVIYGCQAQLDGVRDYQPVQLSIV